MLKGLYSFLLICLISNNFLFAEKKFSDNLFFGGNVGLQFSDITFIEVAPIVGYYLTPRLSAGIGAKYQYYKSNSILTNYQTHVYGGKIFSSYILVNKIPFSTSGKLFIHSEYEILSLEKKHFQFPFNEEGRFLMHSTLVGGGYIQRFSKSTSLSLMVLWNLNEYEYSPYPSPIIRIGFTFNK